MNGTKPKFLEGVQLKPEYYEQPNPYKNALSCNVNLLELSRSAKSEGKALVGLTKEEVGKYSIL